MFRFLAKLVSTSLATLVIVGVACALTIVPYKEKSSGTLTSVVPGHIGFAGVGQATHFGRYSLEGNNDIDAIGNVLNGQLLATTVDGATMTGIFSGTYAPLPTGQIRFDVTVTWQTGTGRLAGITGQANVVALIDGVAPGAAFHAEGLGSLALP